MILFCFVKCILSIGYIAQTVLNSNFVFVYVRCSAYLQIIQIFDNNFAKCFVVFNLRFGQK